MGQVQADLVHHENRITWLSTECPTWACGAVVGRHEITNMINASTEAIRLAKLGVSTSSCHCEKITSVKVDDYADGRAGYEVTFSATRHLMPSTYYVNARGPEVLEVLTWVLSQECRDQRKIEAIRKHFAKTYTGT